MHQPLPCPEARRRATAPRPLRSALLAALTTTLLLGLASPATAASPIGSRHRIGVGVAAGPLGVGPSAKFYWARNRAVQGVFGWYPGGAWSLAVDAVWEFGPAMRDFPGAFFFGIGPGVGVLMADDGLGGNTALAAISLVAEIGFHFRVVPLELVLGWRPTWRNTSGGRNVTTQVGAGGVRWYF